MPDYPFTIFSFLGALLCIEPAHFNWKIPGRPWSALIAVGWILIYNVLSFIDSIVWAGENPDDWLDGNGYCDITARIKTVFPIGVLGSTIGICLFLINSTNLGPSQKDMGPSNGARRNLFDVFLGIVLPIIFMIFHFIVEPNQYAILGVAGCQTTTDLAWPAIILYSVWPPIMTFIALLFASILFPFTVLTS
jgi:pheromone a factor receptor